MSKSEGKFFAIISYLGFFCIISLLMKRDDASVRFHAKQGLVLFILTAVNAMVSVVPVLGGPLSTFFFIVLSMIALWGMFNALRERETRLPLIAAIADKINL